MRYSRGSDGFWVCQGVLNGGEVGVDETAQFRSVNMHSGFIAYNTVDSLSAFWPGLQVLAGDIENAIKAHLICGCRARHSSLTTVTPLL